MTADYYKDILQESLIPSMYTFFPNGNMTFQHDNAPAHTARLTKKFFEDKNIKNMFWPDQSPDLNPIENRWHYVAK